jgi:hypothetical protein
MTTSTPSFLAGVEVTSETQAQYGARSAPGIFPQCEAMAGGSPREGLPGFSKLVPKLLFRLVPTALCPVGKQARATLLCRSPANMTSCWYVSIHTR